MDVHVEGFRVLADFLDERRVHVDAAGRRALRRRGQRDDHRPGRARRRAVDVSRSGRFDVPDFQGVANHALALVQGEGRDAAAIRVTGARRFGRAGHLHVQRPAARLTRRGGEREGCQKQRQQYQAQYGPATSCLSNTLHLNTLPYLVCIRFLCDISMKIVRCQGARRGRPVEGNEEARSPLRRPGPWSAMVRCYPPDMAYFSLKLAERNKPSCVVIVTT